MSMKNSNDAIGNRARDLPACSAVHQPTAPPRAPLMQRQEQNISAVKASTQTPARQIGWKEQVVLERNGKGLQKIKLLK